MTSKFKLGLYLMMFYPSINLNKLMHPFKSYQSETKSLITQRTTLTPTTTPRWHDPYVSTMLCRRHINGLSPETNIFRRDNGMQNAIMPNKKLASMMSTGVLAVIYWVLLGSKIICFIDSEDGWQFGRHRLRGPLRWIPIRCFNPRRGWWTVYMWHMWFLKRIKLETAPHDTFIFNCKKCTPYFTLQDALISYQNDKHSAEPILPICIFCEKNFSTKAHLISPQLIPGTRTIGT